MIILVKVVRGSGGLLLRKGFRSDSGNDTDGSGCRVSWSIVRLCSMVGTVIVVEENILLLLSWCKWVLRSRFHSKPGNGSGIGKLPMVR
jgi:hypothetical protein